MSATYFIKPTNKNANPVEVSCSFCNLTFWRSKKYAADYPSRYCSSACRDKHATAKTYLQIMSRKVDSDEECYEIKDLGYKTKCWVWKFSKSQLGYGMGTYKGKHSYSARKYFYEKHIGEVPKGYFLCHACDQPSCVNPKHLWAGTPKENTQDMFAKGRHNTAVGELVSSSKIKSNDVSIIKMLYKTKQYTQTQLSKIYNIDQGQISRIVNEKAWLSVINNI